jgi:hypothetical protein
MKTAIDWIYEQLVTSDKNEFSSDDLERIYDQAKLIEQEQLRTMHLITWMNKDVDFDNYYFETYEDQRSNIND